MDSDLNETGEWAIVELMGHKVIAGRAVKSEMLGEPMLRVDCPATSVYPGFTQMFGVSAIYCITFVSETVARLAAESAKVNPVSVYVPELITREQHDTEIKSYREEIERLRAVKSLPQPNDQ